MTAVAVTWHAVCRYADLTPERGAAALVGSVQIALFRTFDGSVFAVGNQDPYSGAYVMARGIVGTRAEAPTVASPLHKQVFDLRSGARLDDDATSLPTFPVRVREGVVEVLVA